MYCRTGIRDAQVPTRAMATPVALASLVRLLGALVCLAPLLTGLALAQSPPPPPPPNDAAASTYSPPQLDQIVAPIALYPDELLGQILTAATYPLEIVQADRWLQDPANAALRGDDLARAAAQLPWDPSVRSLTAFPQILAMLDGNLDWTEQLGDAFLAQAPDVMDSVQRLRQQARAAGTLLPSPQQIVTTGDQGIGIAPVDPDVVYVPVYDPQVAYGNWAYADYPPDQFYLPGFAFGSFIGFAIVGPLWGWHHWDWRHHRLDVGAGGPPRGGGRVPGHQIPWQHDPEHRAGVPYRDDGTRARVLGNGDAASRRDRYRGYSSSSALTAAPTNGRQVRPQPLPERAAPSGSAPSRQLPQSRSMPPAALEPIRRAPDEPFARPPPARPPQAAVVERPPPQPRAPAAVAPRPSPPAMESFGSGPQVHAQEQRGASSRGEPPSSGGRGHR
jgi:hypothetical protein